MVEISYTAVAAGISAIWLAIRGACWAKSGSVRWLREIQLLLVYICLLVIARFTFFPFAHLNGRLQPLLFDAARVFPLQLNLTPLVHLADYPEKREVILNVVGNTAMFIPVGVIWPAVYRRWDTHRKGLAAGLGFSLCIEILQLPFFGRVSDVDDLILNTLGFLLGYGIYLVCKKRRKT